MDPVVAKCAEAVGGIAKLASLIGVRHQSLYSWRKVPAERVLDLERHSGVPRHEIRPDIYPAETAEAS
jgi:DNA-binding transcriptional regulator YdaS (Cro superfamily)